MTDQNKATQPQRPAERAVGPDLRSNINPLPGRRDGLPAGSLRGLPPDPQGDENRDPPANAPTIPE
jgi:hypothetical protein